MLPEHVGNGCAGFAIGSVGQQVGIAKAFVTVLGRAHSPVYVHLAAYHVRPEVIHGSLVVRGVRETGNIGHGRVDIPGTHGMARGLQLLDQRFVVLHATIAPSQTGMPHGAAILRIGLTFKSLRFDQRTELVRLAFCAVGMAAFVEQEPAQFQVTRLPCGAIQFDQGQFDFLVSAHVVAFARAEHAVNVVGKPFGRIQGPGLSGQTLMLHRHFKEVSRIVHLVLQTHVIPFLVQAIDDKIRDQIAVVLLSSQDAIKDVLDTLTQDGVIAMLQRVQGAFHGLVQVRIKGMVTAERAVEYAGCLVKIGHVPITFQAVQCVGNGRFVVGIETCPPESVPQCHVIVTDVIQSLLWQYISDARCALT